MACPASNFLRNKLHNCQGVCTVFLPPAWLPSAPFRNPMAAAMAPPVLSSDCPSPGPPSSQQHPGVHAPAIPGRCLAAILLKEVHSDRGGATQRRVGGGWELRTVCSELCLGIKDITCSPFPNISLLSLKTPKTSVIPWVSWLCFLSQKVGASATRQMLACSAGKTIPCPLCRKEQAQHRWAGTLAHLRPPLGVVLVLGLEAMLLTWKELK